MRLGGPVGDGLRHGVGLRPDDVRAQVPAVSLEGEGHAPRDADEVLGLEAATALLAAAGDSVAALRAYVCA